MKATVPVPMIPIYQSQPAPSPVPSGNLRIYVNPANACFLTAPRIMSVLPMTPIWILPQLTASPSPFGSGMLPKPAVQREADGDITCQIEDDDADTTIDDTISSTAATYDDNRWHHVSCVKSGTASLTLYIDAVQIIQDAALDASGTLANDDTFYIGIDGDGTSNDFTGFIDEVKVYRS